eukprot:EG_transcript_2884
MYAAAHHPHAPRDAMTGQRPSRPLPAAVAVGVALLLGLALTHVAGASELFSVGAVQTPAHVQRAVTAPLAPGVSRPLRVSDLEGGKQTIWNGDQEKLMPTKRHSGASPGSTAATTLSHLPLPALALAAATGLLAAAFRVLRPRPGAYQQVSMNSLAGLELEEDATAHFTVDKIRNIAIVAHVDHGKTTLVDKMLSQSKVFRDNQQVDERIMDSNDLEKERGITILSKNTAVRYKDHKINIIDTPGHADFGGEVERILNMVDGVILLVDAREGPMPQTRFVTKKALGLGKKVVVVVNKVDRDGVEPQKVVDATFDLFVDLEASDEQLDFPVVFASGIRGVAGFEPHTLADDLTPLFDTILKEVPAPSADASAPLQMLIANLDYDTHKGRIALGRVQSGVMKRALAVTICTPETTPRNGRVAEIFVYDNFARKAVETVTAGDICAISGLETVSIGETICENGNPRPLPTIKVEEPTVRMTFIVNTSPFAGREGKFVTSRNLKDRLDKELERNLALRVEPGETADEFIVCGRGTLHLSILIENMRREGYEFCVGPPQVITRSTENGRQEPFEIAIVEAKQEYMGAVIDILGQRAGKMLDLGASPAGDSQIVKYRIPTRGLIGVRNQLLTASRGTAVLNTIFDEYDDWVGDINTRATGSLIAHETGQVTSYAVASAQDRGVLFVKPGEEVYQNQVIGIHQRPGDLAVNVCKRKAATNVRSNKDATIVLSPAKVLSLDDNLEYIVNDELVEVTPKSLRVLKNPKYLKR